MKVGIVGHGADKFEDWSEAKAKEVIRQIISYYVNSGENVTLVSGHSPVGGIDIWAEEIAVEFRIDTDIKTPRQNVWDAEYGFKQRNIDIARSDVVHVILVKHYPPQYKGRRFDVCYHCVKHHLTFTHVKSGGCWTGWKAKEFGNNLHFHIISKAGVIERRG